MSWLENIFISLYCGCNNKLLSVFVSTFYSCTIPALCRGASRYNFNSIDEQPTYSQQPKRIKDQGRSRSLTIRYVSVSTVRNVYLHRRGVGRISAGELKGYVKLFSDLGWRNKDCHNLYSPIFTGVHDKFVRLTPSKSDCLLE